jgi:hypothetical protein
MILFEKYGQHQPLNLQADRYAPEGVDNQKMPSGLYCLVTTVVSSTATSPTTLTRMVAPALTVQ